MVSRPDPFTIPEWHSIRREASLVRHLLGSGITSLGKSSYGDTMGEYYTAFFGLSVGIERLAKLILIADHAIENNGVFPDPSLIRGYGHNLVKLVASVDNVIKKRAINLEFTRSNDAISNAVLECLHSFADAKSGRYANFQSLGNPNLTGEFEPIRKWWSEVGNPILEKHYRGTQKERRVQQNAEFIHRKLDSVSVVLFFDESGDMMNDVRTASTRTGETQLVQKYGRFYTLGIIRWLANTYREIAQTACYENEIDAFFGSWEFLDNFRVSNSFLLTRKVWP
jgi:hypothetical protein